MIGIPLAFLAAGAGQWGFHKYVQHGKGRHKHSFFGFHWQNHHRDVRRNGYYDPVYLQPLTQWNDHSKEVVSLVVGGLILTPLLPVAPFFVTTSWGLMAHYYWTHRRSHLDPQWAKKHACVHYDHHMSFETNANWTITQSWFDKLMGTRVPYVGTTKEQRDNVVRASRKGFRLVA